MFGLTVVLIVSITLAAAQCPDGWMIHGGNCYHFSHDKENWIDAQVICEHFGANLAEIHSQFEDNFLLHEADNRKGDFWIGASDLIDENEWRWLQSNKKLDYSNWGPGEPNNQATNENCVEIRNDEQDWNDRPCNYETWYICQKSREWQCTIPSCLLSKHCPISSEDFVFDYLDTGN